MNKPQSGKIYALTGGNDSKCIANGNTWAESEVKTKKVTKKEAMKMLEVLPPTLWYKTKGGETFQVGEATDYENGRATFATYQRKGNQWYFKGYEHKHNKAGKNIVMECEQYLNA